MYRIDGKFTPRNNKLVEGFPSTSGPTMTITSGNVTSASNNLIALTFTASEGVIDFDKNCIKVIGPDSNIISDTDSLIYNFMIKEHEVTFKPYDTACYSTGECAGTLTNYLKPMVFTALEVAVVVAILKEWPEDLVLLFFILIGMHDIFVMPFNYK